MGVFFYYFGFGFWIDFPHLLLGEVWWMVLGEKGLDGGRLVEGCV